MTKEVLPQYRRQQRACKAISSEKVRKEYVKKWKTSTEQISNIKYKNILKGTMQSYNSNKKELQNEVNKSKVLESIIPIPNKKFLYTIYKTVIKNTNNNYRRMFLQERLLKKYKDKNKVINHCSIQKKQRKFVGQTLYKIIHDYSRTCKDNDLGYHTGIQLQYIIERSLSLHNEIILCGPGGTVEEVENWLNNDSTITNCLDNVSPTVVINVLNKILVDLEVQLGFEDISHINTDSNIKKNTFNKKKLINNLKISKYDDNNITEKNIFNKKELLGNLETTKYNEYKEYVVKIQKIICILDTMITIGDKKLEGRILENISAIYINTIKTKNTKYPVMLIKPIETKDSSKIDIEEMEPVPIIPYTLQCIIIELQNTLGLYLEPLFVSPNVTVINKTAVLNVPESSV